MFRTFHRFVIIFSVKMKQKALVYTFWGGFPGGPPFLALCSTRYRVCVCAFDENGW
jgi:hypothetical protein